ncbi:hypothetical protein GQ600_11511 [Phytophthora cactorum]|nr:hypothetical protein GQ600_11511 [Phytophthora cactorum]
MTPVTVVEQPQPTSHDTTGSTEMVGITASSAQSSGSANPTNGDSGDISSDAAEEDEFELERRYLARRMKIDRDDEAVIVDDDGGDSNYESEGVYVCMLYITTHILTLYMMCCIGCVTASCILSSDSEDDLNKIQDGEDPNGLWRS